MSTWYICRSGFKYLDKIKLPSGNWRYIYDDVKNSIGKLGSGIKDSAKNVINTAKRELDPSHRAYEKDLKQRRAAGHLPRYYENEGANRSRDAARELRYRNARAGYKAEQDQASDRSPSVTKESILANKKAAEHAEYLKDRKKRESSIAFNKHLSDRRDREAREADIENKRQTRERISSNTASRREDVHNRRDRDEAGEASYKKYESNKTSYSRGAERAEAATRDVANPSGGQISTKYKQAIGKANKYNRTEKERERMKNKLNASQLQKERDKMYEEREARRKEAEAKQKDDERRRQAYEKRKNTAISNTRQNRKKQALSKYKTYG